MEIIGNAEGCAKHKKTIVEPLKLKTENNLNQKDEKELVYFIK